MRSDSFKKKVIFFLVLCMPFSFLASLKSPKDFEKEHAELEQRLNTQGNRRKPQFDQPRANIFDKKPEIEVKKQEDKKEEVPLAHQSSFLSALSAEEPSKKQEVEKKEEAVQDKRERKKEQIAFLTLIEKKMQKEPLADQKQLAQEIAEEIQENPRFLKAFKIPTEILGEDKAAFQAKLIEKFEKVISGYQLTKEKRKERRTKNIEQDKKTFSGQTSFLASSKSVPLASVAPSVSGLQSANAIKTTPDSIKAQMNAAFVQKRNYSKKKENQKKRMPFPLKKAFLEVPRKERKEILEKVKSEIQQRIPKISQQEMTHLVNTAPSVA